MKSLLYILTLVVLGNGWWAPLFAESSPAAESSIALISKVILDVERKGAASDWTPAKRGETLISGEKIKTGEKSLAIIKFKDNSLVRVREKSELTVTGTVSGAAFSKTVNLPKGAVGFNIEKQQAGEEFRFTSPTSVASIRGTSGQFIVGEGSDTLIVMEGKIRFSNTLSTNFVDVDAGSTAISQVDGSVSARPSFPAERTAAADALKEGDQENKLEMEFRDPQGNKKQLKIEYK
jgi:hypothetical protein